MVAGHTIPEEVGPRWDCGIVSPTYGQLGLVIKSGTYRRDQQLIKRQDVVAALQTALADRDINFWTRVTQTQWHVGSGRTLFVDGEFFENRGIDPHILGELSAWPTQSVLTSITTGAIGRGAAVAAAGVGGAAVAAFAWTDGNYIFSANITAATPTFTTYTTGGAGTVLDIVSDGTNLYFATSGTGVWTTVASAPGNLTQYDAGANGPYHRLVWDSLRRQLYGIHAPSAGRALHRINSAAAPTVIYDFQQGRLDAIENIFGRIYVAWNTGAAINNSQGRAAIYYWDGTNVLEAAIGADGAHIISIKIAATLLWAGVIFNDVFASTDLTTVGSLFTLCFVSGGTVAGYRNLADGRLLQHAATFSPMYGVQDFVALMGTPGERTGGQTFFGVGPYVWSYDQGYGGAKRIFGRSTVSVGGTSYTPHIVGLIAVGDQMMALALLLNTAFTNVGGMVWQVSGSATPNQVADATDNTLASSRIDLGLPYVDKFWHAFEVVCEPLAAGEQIRMEYSVDDATTWTLCQSTAANPNPYTTISGTRPVFLIQRANPHIRYRIQLIGVTSTPRVHAVSAQFAPANPELKMWRFTAQCRQSMRLRNGQVDQTNPRDAIKFLFDIAERSEPVTFYDNNEELISGGNRQPHSVWVMEASQATLNTSNEYKPLLQEGDIDLILWETRPT